MRLADVIDIRDFPAVVQAADVRAHRSGHDAEAVADFMSGYLGYDARARHALTETVTSLAQTGRGGAFWLNGVFGCGKSHLLGLLALLCDGIGHEDFAVNHPFLAPLLPELKPRLVVHFSLDDYEAERWSLEAAFWREVEAEWSRRGFGELDIDRSGSRGEAFAALEEALREKELLGLAVFIDELSLFLGGREHRALQGDAAFLQFLGQHSRRSPLWIFAALQKNVEDIAGFAAYSLSQIRDRYVTLSLSLANLPAILEKRLVVVRDEARVQRVCDESWNDLSRALPRQEFGPREWRTHFPFHPATIALVEQVVARFFSRTRSAMLFCSCAVDVERPVTERVGPDELFDYLLPEFEAHPDLRQLLPVWEAWQDGIGAIAGRESDVEPLRRVMKLMLLFKVAGATPTPVQIANALSLDAGLSGDGNYEYARHLLERLRTRAAYVAVERDEESIFDRYTIDLGQRVGELLRRHVRATLDTVPSGDPRVPASVLSVCREEPLPLAELISGPRSYSLFWNNAPRRLLVEIWQGGSVDGLANRVTSTRDPGSGDDALLLILPPFAETDLEVEAVAAQLEAASLPAFWLWKPRPPLREERDLAREVTAATLLEADPQLLDNRRGRAVLERLKAEAPGRAAQIQRVALRLLREGTVYLGEGANLEAGELAGADTWTGLLEAVGNFAFPHLFPCFSPIAPRARLLTPSNADALCLEILRRPAAEPYFAPSLERLARHIGEPLGVARSAAGRWKISVPLQELAGSMRQQVEGGVTLAALDAHYARSGWGLRPEQTAILVCALLRGGEIAALDGRGQELVPAQIGLPLRRSVHSLRPGRLLSMESWARLQTILGRAARIQLSLLSFEAQDRARQELLQWREQFEAEANLLRARAAQLRRQLGHGAESWSRFEAASTAIGTFLENIPTTGSAYEILGRVAALEIDALSEHLDYWKRCGERLENRLNALLSQHAILSHPDLVAPQELADARGELLIRFAAGEAVLADEDLVIQAGQWVAAYTEKYNEWHASQHQAERWNSLRRLASTQELMALERLASLLNRPFPYGPAVRAESDAEIGKFCGRVGPLGVGEACCNSCGLRYGQRVTLRSPRELETEVEKGVEALHKTLAEPPVRDFLMRARSPLVEWDGAAENLAALMTAANLQVLDDALRPRRQVERTQAALLEALGGCRSRRDLELAFAEWLDAGENLSPDDEVVLVV